MIYTLGYAPGYQLSMAEARARGDKPLKVGRIAPCPEFPKGYSGGSVWQTAEEVRQHIRQHNLRDYRVWGVKADWERDTAPPLEKDAPWRDLLVDSEIVDLADTLDQAINDYLASHQ